MKKDWRRTSIEKRNTAKQNKSTEGKFARSRAWARSRAGGTVSAGWLCGSPGRAEEGGA